MTRLLRQPSKAAKPVLDGLLTLFSPLARKLRRSVTFDNGSELSLHSALSAQLGFRTPLEVFNALSQRVALQP